MLVLWVLRVFGVLELVVYIVYVKGLGRGIVDVCFYFVRRIIEYWVL